MSKLSLSDRAALWHAFFSVSDTVAASPTRFFTRGGCSLVHRQAYTPPDPCKVANKTLPDPCRQDAAARQALQCGLHHGTHATTGHYTALRATGITNLQKSFIIIIGLETRCILPHDHLSNFSFKIFIPILSAAFHSAYLWAVCSLGRRFRFSPEIHFYSCSIRGVDYCLACDIICLRWFLSLTRVFLFKIETVRF